MRKLTTIAVILSLAGCAPQEKSESEKKCIAYSNMVTMHPNIDWRHFDKFIIDVSKTKNIPADEDFIRVAKQKPLGVAHFFHREFKACAYNENRPYDERMRLSQEANKISNTFADDEAKIFKIRTGGHACGQLIFLLPPAMHPITPEKGCVFSDNTSMLVANQVMGKEMLASHADPSYGKTILIDKGDLQIVDGERIRPAYYLYTGTRTYSSILGAPRTVLSFKMLPWSVGKDISFFGGK